MTHTAMFEGRTCRKCGGNVRYVSNRKCVECRKAINAENYQRRKLVEQVEARHD